MSSCARCSGALRPSDVGEGVLRCDGCGTFVCTAAARQKLCRFLSVTDEIWSGLLHSGGRGATCPLCQTTMRLANLKGVAIDGCPSVGCGALLLDPGELRRLTGRDEGAPTSLRTPIPIQGSQPTSSDGIGRVFVPAANALAAFLATVPWIQVAQQRQYMEGFVGLEFGNRYVIRTPAGAGSIVVNDSVAGAIARMFLGGLLTSRYVLADSRDNPCLILDRRFQKVILSRLDVSLAEGGEAGRRLGGVERNLRVLSSAYELTDANGQVFARLVRPFTSLWQFRLSTADGTASGAIAKQWSGFATEWLTDADDFGIDFGAHPWSLEQRAIIVAAALAIDLDHFERRGGSRSMFDLLR